MSLHDYSQGLASTIPQTGSLASNTFLGNGVPDFNKFQDFNANPELMSITPGSLALPGATGVPKIPGALNRPKTKFGKGMDLAGLALDGAGLFMNYQAMQSQNKYNDANMKLLQEQQGLAKRAADTNFANQQTMAAQMV